MGLDSWLRKLNMMTKKQWETIAVDSLFRELAEPPEDWYAHLQFCEDSYTRNLVGRNEFYELIAIGWLGHQRTPIQDHSGQRCWMWVVHGSLKFQNFQKHGAGVRPSGEAKEFGVGNQLYVDDEIGWLSIENPTHRPAVSLHLYSNPISHCQIYDEVSQSIELKALETVSVHGDLTPI